MRETAGDDLDLCVEIHRRLTPAEAVVLARGIEPYHPMFIEDPMRPENADAMARIAEKIRIPIATGERFSTIYEFQAALSRKAVEYARADLCLCGGITGGRKIAAMAEAHNVMMVPHNPLSPVGLAIKLPARDRTVLMDAGGRPLRYFPKAPVKKDYVIVPDDLMDDLPGLKTWIAQSLAEL